VRFLIDTQLPLKLAEWFREQGHEAEHVLEIGLGQAKDNPIWTRASAQGAVIVTKDEDFAEWVRRGRQGPSVVWLRIGNCSNRALIVWLTPLLPVIVAELHRGNRLVEVR
jgi:predicted nuclease of predicted toxin-antitoxin system